MSWGAVAGAAVGVVGGAILGGKSGDAQADASAASIAEQRRQFDLIRGDTAKARQLGNSAINSINSLYGYGTTQAKPLSFEEWSKQNGGGPGLPIMGNIPGLEGRMQHGGPGGIQGGQNNGYAQYVAQFNQDNPAHGRQPNMGVFFNSPDYKFNLQEGQKSINNSAAAQGGLLSGAAVKAGARYASNLASGEYGNFYNRLAAQAGIGQSAVNQSAQAGMQAAGNIGNSYMNAGQARAGAYESQNNVLQGGIGNILSAYLNRPSPNYSRPTYGGANIYSGGF